MAGGRIMSNATSLHTCLNTYMYVCESVCVGLTAGRQANSSENLYSAILHMVGACLSVSGGDEPNQRKCLYSYVYMSMYVMCVCLNCFEQVLKAKGIAIVKFV